MQSCGGFVEGPTLPWLIPGSSGSAREDLAQLCGGFAEGPTGVTRLPKDQIDKTPRAKRRTLGEGGRKDQDKAGRGRHGTPHLHDARSVVRALRSVLSVDSSWAKQFPTS